ncbi:hypothetical protein [Embleya scabrispora]|uniref:hypothetical protein n=1 Tax=Embleya scabrispora TaxID=159449 RepID=UPI00036D269A|nr:hypothetical protein [Embleya scabrispora]MYS80023.1 hypothetical protein [Streptomyces sp. SID5474]
MLPNSTTFVASESGNNDAIGGRDELDTGRRVSRIGTGKGLAAPCHAQAGGRIRRHS